MVTFQDAHNTIRELIFTLYTVVEEGVSEHSAQTEQVVIGAIGRANKFLVDSGHEPVSYEEWRAEQDTQILETVFDENENEYFDVDEYTGFDPSSN